MTPRERIVWRRATERLAEDPAFAALVERVGPVRLRPRRGTAFESLVAAIVYQQLAGRAAKTIHARFTDALGGEVTAPRVLDAADETLRGAGLSAAKLAAIRDLARRSLSGEVPLEGLDRLSDDEVVASLTRVRGIGAWTAHMYLMFELARPDVWPTGDLGVRAGLGRVLGMAPPPDPRATELIGIGYRPWRSAVAWYCWRALEPAGG